MLDSLAKAGVDLEKPNAGNWRSRRVQGMEPPPAAVEAGIAQGEKVTYRGPMGEERGGVRWAGRRNWRRIRIEGEEGVVTVPLERVARSPLEKVEAGGGGIGWRSWRRPR